MNESQQGRSSGHRTDVYDADELLVFQAAELERLHKLQTLVIRESTKRLEELQSRLSDTREERILLENTKLFRWSSHVRSGYATARRVIGERITQR